MGAHYIMKEPRKNLIAIACEKNEADSCTMKALARDRIIMVLEGGEEGGENVIVIVTPEQVVVNHEKLYNYELLGWKVEGDTCLFLLGKSYVVEKFLWVDLIKRTATIEVAGDCHIVAYFVKDGEFYQKRYTSTHYYGVISDKENVNFGTIPLEWCKPQKK